MGTSDFRGKAFFYAMKVVESSVAQLEFTVAYTYALIASKVVSERKDYKMLLKSLERAQLKSDAVVEENMEPVYVDFAAKFRRLHEKISLSEQFLQSKSRMESCTVM